MINFIKDHTQFFISDIVTKICLVFSIWFMWSKVSENQKVALEGMYDALNIKSPYYFNHSKRVGLICEAICSHMAIDGLEKKEILSAAQLHDIGKLFIDEAILHAERKLTESEWAIVKLHPVKGRMMAERFHQSPAVGNLILAHHENLDGTGYPLNLAGEDIPKGARILRIADSIDAMAMPRPYRPAMTFEHIVSELTINAGRWYDEEIIKLITNGLSKRIRLIILNNC